MITVHPARKFARPVIEIRRTPWSGFYRQRLIGRHHHVRRYRLHIGHWLIVLLWIPRHVRIRREDTDTFV